ncbi:MAG: xylanase, partial [Blastopirellula sp.]
MKPWKSFLLNTYYHASRPWRWRYRRVHNRTGLTPVMSLFYHRVADDHPNGWTISRSGFEQQLDWLQENVELVSLYEAQQRIKNRYNDKPCVAITFDDGYAENCEHALPLLIKRKIPCTYFVCTSHIVNGLPFPHDVERGTPFPPNTVEQLKALAGSGIEIGAHTRTHANLGIINDEQQLQDEVIDATRHLEQLIDRPIRYFAFPYGMPENLNDRTFQLCKEAGLHGVCSAYGGYNFPG